MTLVCVCVYSSKTFRMTIVCKVLNHDHTNARHILNHSLRNPTESSPWGIPYFGDSLLCPHSSTCKNPHCFASQLGCLHFHGQLNMEELMDPTPESAEWAYESLVATLKLAQNQVIIFLHASEKFNAEYFCTKFPKGIGGSMKLDITHTPDVANSHSSWVKIKVWLGGMEIRGNSQKRARGRISIPKLLYLMAWAKYYSSKKLAQILLQNEYSAHMYTLSTEDQVKLQEDESFTQEMRKHQGQSWACVLHVICKAPVNLG